MADMHLPLYAGIFLSGVAVAYLVEGVLRMKSKGWALSEKQQLVIHRGGMVLLLFYLLTCTGRLWGGELVFCQLFTEFYGVVAAMLVAAIALTRGSLLSRVLSSQPLRALGLVSFSLYLVHPIIMQVLQKSILHYTDYCLSGPFLFMITLLVSYVCACVSYSFIEKPCMG